MRKTSRQILADIKLTMAEEATTELPIESESFRQMYRKQDGSLKSPSVGTEGASPRDETLRYREQRND